MNRIELGRKIKEARLAKKMTQSDVAGDFITRNMLSQIESGAANPSLKTLEYLTSVLDIPIQTLLPDGRTAEKEEAENTLYEILLDMKEFYSEENYVGAVETAERLFDTALCDEAYAVAARSYINMSLRSEKENDFSKSADYAYKAYEYAEKGLYASRDITTTLALLLNRIAEKLKIEN